VGKRIHSSVSAGLDNNILMINKAIEILVSYVEHNPEPARLKQSYEGVLGYRMLLNRKHFERGFREGAGDLMNLIAYVLKPGVFSVFLKKKAFRKFKKLLGLNVYDFPS
jgi:hypothetical protein